jgi:hypothetical protein
MLDRIGPMTRQVAVVAAWIPAHVVFTMRRNVSKWLYATTAAATSATIAMMTMLMGFAFSATLSAHAAAAHTWNPMTRPPMVTMRRGGRPWGWR